MSRNFSMNGNNEPISAAALSKILGKQILLESSVPRQTKQHISKVSLFDQHSTSFVYGKVGLDNKNSNELFLTLHITILATQKTFSCLIKHDATVDKLKQIIYRKEGILCNKQNLIYCGQEIDEGHRLSEYDIQDADEISVMRLRAMNVDDILVLDPTSLDPRYDYDFTDIDDRGRRFMRGGIEYHRPCGWQRFAIKVTDRYKDKVWLGSNNNPYEWPVSYHGTKHDAVRSIAKDGYDLTKHKRFMFGRGIYSTPNIDVAKAYAAKFIFQGHQYCVVLQNRVNPNNLIKVANGGGHEYWISPTGADIRPYGYCIMKIS